MSARVAVRQPSSSSSSLSSFSLVSRSLPPVPPPATPGSGESGCCRDKEDEIYITSASVIELDCRKAADNDSYDSGIYNSSTHTGWSSCSDKSSSRARGHGQGAASTFLKVVTVTEGEEADYEEQVISVWLDSNTDTADYSSEDEESVYETLSDSASVQAGQVTVQQEDSNLTRIAVAAGNSIKKLRRNWSLKKEDLTKGLSKIKRNSKSLIEDVYTKEVKFSSVGRRKLSMSQLLSAADPSQAQQPPSPHQHTSSFYIGLAESGNNNNSNNNKSWQFSRSGSVLSDISESDIVTDFSPPLSLSSMTSLPASLPSNTSPSGSTSAPVRPRRRSGKSGGRSVLRPSDPPPPPPINLDTHPLNLAPAPGSVATLAAEISVSVRGLTSELGSGLEEEEGETIYFSRLMPNEPLYQFYETLPLPAPLPPACAPPSPLHVRTGPPEAVNCGGGSIVSQSGQRSLWCDMPQVAASSLLHTISPQTRRLQEAKFEIISSEASYLRSLNVLVSQFANSTKLRHNSAVISAEDWAAVFSNIYQVRECSEKFLQSLETCWQRSIMMHGLSELLLGAARSEFEVFIEYCSNQAEQERTLKRLRNVNTNFASVLQDLESSQVCQALSLHSFLMLPMQRITRLPLLTAAILGHCESGEGERAAFQQCLDTLNTLVASCNEAARHRERQDQLVKINQNLDFKQVEWLYLVTPSRWLVAQVAVTRLCWREASTKEKITWGRRVSKVRLQLLLFTDLLLVCKKKRDERLLVVDHCPRNLLDLSAVELSGLGSLASATLGLGALLSSGLKSAAWLTLIQNSSKRTCEMIILFDSLQDRTAWVSLVQPAQEAGEKVYESWSRPSVEVTTAHQPSDTTELAVSVGDTASVVRKADSGLVYLERGDGARGWVPASCVRELHSDHMRARHFKQRYQFLKALAELDMAPSEP